MTGINRTPLQRRADSLDCDLYRIIHWTEQLYDEHKRNVDARSKLHKALMTMRSARAELRMLMHDADRARTA